MQSGLASYQYDDNVVSLTCSMLVTRQFILFDSKDVEVIFRLPTNVEEVLDVALNVRKKETFPLLL